MDALNYLVRASERVTDPGAVILRSRDEIPPRLTRARAITAMVALTAMHAAYFGGGPTS